MSSLSPQRERLIFQHPPGSRLDFDQGHAIVYVPGSSGVVLHESLVRVWQAADGRRLPELAALFDDAGVLMAQLIALRAAGLLLPPLAEPPRPHSRPLPESPPLISVVIVTRNGRHHLEECLPSLAAQTYPCLEVIIVDDASTDGTVEFVRENFPASQVIELIGGPNFAAGCNRGIERAAGELIFLLNNDTVLDPHCLEEMAAAQAGCAEVGGVAAMLRFYDNRPFVNGLGTFVPRQGLGHDVGIGNLDVGQFDRIGQVPLLCFGAALIPRAALERTGPLDEAYQFYYEDADWSYRARALGLELIAAPRARVYHKFGASTSALPSAFKVRLASRNRLRFTLKNLSRLDVARQLTTCWVDDVIQALTYLKHGRRDLARAVAVAWGEFLRNVPAIQRERRRLWSRCARRPVNLSALAEALPSPEMQGGRPLLTPWAIERKYRHYLAQRADGPTSHRVLIISPDVVNVNMGGVGMRYWELAHCLAKHVSVTLAVPARTEFAPQTFAVETYTEGREETLKPLVEAADVILLSGFVVHHHPFLQNVPQYLVVDLYDPTVLENLERFAAQPMEQQMGLHQVGVTAYNNLFQLGDLFVCATEKQRDYWLGALTAANRVNPLSYQADPTLRRLIDVVPFGLPDHPPQPTRRVLKGVHPGIGDNDRVILWGGGLWDWLDPLAAIEAMPEVLRRVPQARLFFMGVKHPNPQVPPSRMAQRAIERATQLGLAGRAVFFNDWTPYAERVNYLAEADVAVSLHGDHIETRFSVRTRLMDYLWASLPMVVTGGDTLSDLVAANGLGRVVAPGDAQAVAEGLVEMLQAPPDRARFEPVADQFRWSRVAEPLIHYAAAPWWNREREAQAMVTTVQPTPLAQLPLRALTALRERGLGGLLRDIRSYIVWRLTRW